MFVLILVYPNEDEIPKTMSDYSSRIFLLNLTGLGGQNLEVSERHGVDSTHSAFFQIGKIRCKLALGKLDMLFEHTNQFHLPGQCSG